METTTRARVEVFDQHGRHLAYSPTLTKVKHGNDDSGKKASPFHLVMDPDDEPNLVTSKTRWGTHRPILDLDFACRLIPSQTPGKFHLYMDGIEVSEDDWRNVLDALADANIIQRKWADNINTNGAVALRLPVE